MRNAIKVISICIMLVSVAVIGSATVTTMQSKCTNALTTYEQTVDITYPKVGYVNAYGGGVPLKILKKLGWGVQIDHTYLVKANVTGDVDKVVFTLLSQKGGDAVVLNDTEAPFEVNFEVKTGPYNVTATAYYQDALVAEDSEGPIFYLHGLIKKS